MKMSQGLNKELTAEVPSAVPPFPHPRHPNSLAGMGPKLSLAAHCESSVSTP